jgi:hypothetical protein
MVQQTPRLVRWRKRERQLRVALLSFLGAFLFVASTAVDEQSGQRPKSTDDGNKTLNVLAQRNQDDSTNDGCRPEDEREDLPQSFVSNVAFYDGLFEVLSMRRLRLCHFTMRSAHPGKTELYCASIEGGGSGP